MFVAGYEEQTTHKKRIRAGKVSDFSLFSKFIEFKIVVDAAYFWLWLDIHL